MAEIITHSFVSAKTQSPDTTLVSKNEWNDGHVFSGGINGQVLVYDNTQPNNMRWTDGTIGAANTSNVSNPTASPITNLAPLSFTLNSPNTALTIVEAQVATTGSVTYQIEVILDSTTVISTFFASNTFTTVTQIYTIAAGAHTLFARITSTGGVSFTGGFVACKILTTGV